MYNLNYQNYKFVYCKNMRIKFVYGIHGFTELQKKSTYFGDLIYGPSIYYNVYGKIIENEYYYKNVKNGEMMYVNCFGFYTVYYVDGYKNGWKNIYNSDGIITSKYYYINGNEMVFDTLKNKWRYIK